MDKYRLTEPLTVEINTSMHGQVTVSFEAGTVTPKNEAEEAALEHAVDLAVAERVAAPATGKTTKKAEEATP